MSILNLPVISRIRRNHGPEHASLTTLSLSNPTLAQADTQSKRLKAETRNEPIPALPIKKQAENQPPLPPRNRNWLTWVIGIGLVGLVGCSLFNGGQVGGGPTDVLATNTPAATFTYPPEFTTTSIVTVKPSATTTPELGGGSPQIRPADGMTMLYVPAGEFSMGSNTSDVEKPIHTVFMDAYWIDQTEVTNGMYARCVADGACQLPSFTSSNTRSSYYANSQYANYPVIYVDWNAAVAYCGWAGAELPSEAQWEKAARGTDGHTYPWGKNIDNTPANYNRNVGDTTEVGKYPDGASPYGALDMAGNVWEWVNDWYDPDYYNQSPTSNPTGPDSGTYRGLRGGSWYFDKISLRAASRFDLDPDYSYDYLGFRCARDASQ